MDRSSAIQQIKLENEGSFEGEFDEESLFGNSNCLTTESITAHCYRKVKTSILHVKFVFSKKATKIDEIFTVDLTLTT